MGYKRRSQHSKPRASTFGLNITSMTDMFTILLVFLLQTYSTSDVQIIPDKDTKLPVSTAEANPVDSIQMAISPVALRIGERTIASVQDSHFDAKDIDQHDSNFIKPLFDELQKLNAAAAAKLGPDGLDKNGKKVEPGKILLQADERLSYDILRKVMYTASMAGFPKLKLATVVSQ